MKLFSAMGSTSSFVLRNLCLITCGTMVSLIAMTSKTCEAQDPFDGRVPEIALDLSSVEAPRQTAMPAFTVPAGVMVVAQAVQEEAVEAAEETQDQAAEKTTESAIEEPTAIPAPKKPEIAKKFVKFHMWDGSIVGGEVQIDAITVRTEFGPLEVPIEDIRRFYPGLNSFPKLTSKIDKLVQDLGDPNYEVREKSNRELTSMGPKIRNELNRFDDGGSAERKKRIAGIKKAIDEELDSMGEDDLANDPLNQPLIHGDKVNTPLFSIVGKIKQEEFVLTSKFGELTVKLSDVRMADRSFNDVAESVRKKCEVDGHAFFQKNIQSTQIRLNKGDKVSITADGVIQWTNWSTSSSPDGLTNQGKYQNIQCGTLCARVGTTGKVIKIGSKGSFVTKRSGVLYLAIAMQDSYTNNSGYKWVGKYKARIEVKPANN